MLVLGTILVTQGLCSSEVYPGSQGLMIWVCCLRNHSSQLLFQCQRPTAGWVLVANAYNPSYSGVRDQEYCSSKPAQTNSS
jgi:hypothetical protein